MLGWRDPNIISLPLSVARRQLVRFIHIFIHFPPYFALELSKMEALPCRISQWLARESPQRIRSRWTFERSRFYTGLCSSGTDPPFVVKRTTQSSRRFTRKGKSRKKRWKRKDKREKFDRSNNRRQVIPSRSRVPETKIPTFRSSFTPEIEESYLTIILSSIRERERMIRSRSIVNLGQNCKQCLDEINSVVKVQRYFKLSAMYIRGETRLAL